MIDNIININLNVENNKDFGTKYLRFVKQSLSLRELEASF
jgi:hypothetical protein